jgi:hypothetical protein
LTQQGQQLLWQVELDRPFSPETPVRLGGSLCLLIERVRGGMVARQLCVLATGGHRRRPRLLYLAMSPDGAASEGVIAAQVRQMSRTQLAATFLPAAVGIGYGQLRWQVLSAPPPATCVPRASSRIGCLALFPAKPALSRVHTPRLVGCVPTGPAFVARGPADRRQWR